MKTIRYTLLALVVVVLSISHSVSAEAEARKGLWISVVGEKDIYESPEAMDEALNFAQSSGFQDLFVQVLRADQAWYNSSIVDSSRFKQNKALFGEDAFLRLISRAHDRGLEVHAWLNTLTLSKNEDSAFLKKEGRTILTKDQHKQDAVSDGKKVSHYMREDQLFMEPGDWRVKDRIQNVVLELASRYPELDGIHFDYIRYPAAPPFIPGSRFNSVGLSYGYGEANVRLFKKRNGKDIDPYNTMNDRYKSEAWDDWKRNRVTTLLEGAVAGARKASPNIQISCAVLGTVDRAYLYAYQDWPSWIDKGLADFVVLMNYSTDSRYAELVSRSALGLVDDTSKVRVGLGAFLMKNDPGMLSNQIKRSSEIGVGGIVLFDYSTLKLNPKVAKAATEVGI